MSLFRSSVKRYLALILCVLFSKAYGSTGGQHDEDPAIRNLSLIQTHEFMSCREDWYQYGHKCYKASDEELSWDDALRHCSQFGGSLASVHSDEEQAFLVMYLLLNSRANLWIGLHDQGIEANYSWSDSSKYSYSNWDFMEPSDEKTRHWGRGEDCVQMRYTAFKTHIGTWNDVSCGAEARFICETDKGDQHKVKNPLHCGKHGGWKFQNSCFYYVNEQKAWEEAEEHCRKKHKGHLITVENTDVETFLKYMSGHVLHLHDIWIGIKIRSEWQQVWSSGWFVRTAVVHSEEGDCVSRDPAGKWVVIPCTKKRPFICEFSSITAPTLEPSSSDLVCPKEPTFWRDLGGEVCYFFDLKSPLTWYEANLSCKRRGGTLTSIHSKGELDVLRQFLVDTEIISIGLYQKMTDGEEFAWVDGSPTDFTAWGEDEPNSISEQCTEIRTKNMLWNDIPCDKKLGHICSVKKIPRAIRDGSQVCDRTEIEENASFRKAECPKGGYNWISFAGAYCYGIILDRADAYRALFHCMRLGGTLATISSREDLDNLKPLLTASRISNSYHIGLFRNSEGNEFLWDDNSVLNFTAWARREPNSKDEICTEMFLTLDWNDVDCKKKTYSICSVRKTLNGVKPKTFKEICHARIISESQSACSGYCRRVLAVVFSTVLGVAFVSALIYFIGRFSRSQDDSRSGILQRLIPLNSWRTLSKKDEEGCDRFQLIH